MPVPCAGATAEGIVTMTDRPPSLRGCPSSTTTIPVQAKLTHPGASGTLDQAPVMVNITTESIPGPVRAHAGGGVPAAA
jgi:hypothetical protein